VALEKGMENILSNPKPQSFLKSNNLEESLERENPPSSFSLGREEGKSNWKENLGNLLGDINYSMGLVRL
jgi:hypothetical protein